MTQKGDFIVTVFHKLTAYFFLAVSSDKMPSLIFAKADPAEFVGVMEMLWRIILK